MRLMLRAQFAPSKIGSPLSDTLLFVPRRHSEEAALSTLSNGLRLLCTFSLQEPELGISELARRLSISKSAAQRLVSTFVAHGFLARTDEGRYRLGMRLFEVASLIPAGLELRQVASPHLRHLAHQAQETVHLAVREDLEIFYIHKIEPSRTIRMYSRVGRRAPMYCTGVGKAILAFESNQIIEAVIAAGLNRFTDATLVEPEALRAELARIRTCGYSLDREEIEEGLRCVAAPLRDHLGQVVAGISLAGPARRLTPQRVREFIPHVVATAAHISTDLGYSPERVALAAE